MIAKPVALVLLLAAITTSASASTVFSVTDSNSTPTYTVLLGADSQQAKDLVGLSVTATFSGGTTSTANCSLDASASCSTAQFSFATSNANAVSSSSIWTLTNLQTSSTLLSLTLNATGIQAIFTPCIGSTVMAGNNCKNVVGDSSGTATAGADAVYSGAYHTSANTVPDLSATGLQWDGFGVLTLSFSGGTFSTNQTFAFSLDTDSLGGTPVADSVATPEPSSVALLGIGLSALGCFNRRRKR